MANPIHDLMYRGESGAAGYNAYNRGTYTDAAGNERIRAGGAPMDFSSFTLGEVQDLQHLPRRDPDRLFAVGKYQIIPGTMDAAVARLGLDRDEAFTPELQDRIFTDYLLRQKQPGVRDYIEGKPGVTLEQAQHGLAREWASFGDPYKEGRSYYGGANRAHISLEQSEAALTQMRAGYAAAIDRGLSSDEAWRVATAIDPEQRTQARPSAARTDPLADGLLRHGEKGDPIRELQQSLHELGYTGRDGKPLSLDGDFGANTGHAVRAYQREHGLKVDGIAGPRTLESIEQQRQEQTQASPEVQEAISRLDRLTSGQIDPSAQQAWNQHVAACRPCPDPVREQESLQQRAQEQAAEQAGLAR
ncbi:peptidoglycan-binding protein [Marilutibacter alkalisoli]|uniref:Peptidoglycan binding-like domain-containing protein n=1 Tax=Marilutibacter alkalisoli TaxID=2591633 RepID=A0A514BWG9_9GAMM|nr:peptidoglycan-binding protein [Lysobacter alkalisoli]QDH71339.1 hypothetical protein FKV23_15515 [Lysobacter alkalisoli]